MLQHFVDVRTVGGIQGSPRCVRKQLSGKDTLEQRDVGLQYFLQTDYIVEFAATGQFAGLILSSYRFGQQARDTLRFNNRLEIR